MEKAKRTRSQEDASKKRKEPEEDPLPLILSELNKIKDRQDWLGQRMKKMEDRIKKLEGSFDAHILTDSNGATTAANTISSLSTQVDDYDECCCPFNLHCAQHPERKEVHRGY